MVSYVKGPAYKSLKSIIGINAPVLKSYIPNFMVWGAAGAAGVAVFTEGVPKFQKTFYQKIPYFGNHWIYNPDPEEVPV